jgi:single-strand DNA-binding protein
MKVKEMSINKVMISGNLTRDPELRSTPAGTSVLSFGVAVNDRRRNAQSGEWEDYANFIDCTIFGARADALSKILTKGMKVAIEGKLNYSSWESDGQRRSRIVVYVDEIEFMSSRSGGNGGGGGNYASDGGRDYSAADIEIPPAPEITVYDEDIPF